MIQHQHAEYQGQVAKQRSRIPHTINTPIFAILIGEISTYALHKLADELARSRKSDFNRTCTGTFTRIMGLPCAHTLSQRAQSNKPLQLHDIHRHWFFSPRTVEHLTSPLLDPRLLNPLPIQPRGRPQQITSTRRNPSEFETVASRVRRRQARTRGLQAQQQVQEDSRE